MAKKRKATKGDGAPKNIDDKKQKRTGEASGTSKKKNIEVESIDAYTKLLSGLGLSEEDARRLCNETEPEPPPVPQPVVQKNNIIDVAVLLFKKHFHHKLSHSDVSGNKAATKMANSIEKAKVSAINELGMIWRVEYIRRQLSHENFVIYFTLKSNSKIETSDENGKIVLKLKSTLRDNSKKKFEEVVKNCEHFDAAFSKSTIAYVRAKHMNDDANEKEEDNDVDIDDDGDDDESDDDDDDDDDANANASDNSLFRDVRFI
jgi:hypothetical protein